MKRVALVALVLVSFPVFSQTFELVRRIEFSVGSGALSFVSLPSAAVYRPSHVGFDLTGDVFIIDNANKSLNIYDPEMEPLRWVDLSAFPAMAEARTIKVFENGDVLNAFAYLRRANEEGKEIYSFDPVQKGLTDYFDDERIWVIGNYVLLYSDANRPILIDLRGRVLGDQDAQSIIERWRNDSPVLRHLKNPSALNSFLETHRLVLVGNRLFTEDTYLLSDYFQMLYENSSSEGAKKPFDLRQFQNTAASKGSGNLFLCEFDVHDNMYLNLEEKNGPQWLCVLDHSGTLLARIQWYALFPSTFYGNLDVSPSGDVYSYTIDRIGKAFSFYRMKNTWDPITLSQAVTAPAASAVISSLSASSMHTEPTDKNAYHPVKLFDGDPKTMWIESAPGPGIGESVTVGFDLPITVDEIQFEPGCFWPEYWKQNYRVKQLEVRLDDKTFKVNFTDQMVVQSLKLPSAVTFTTAGFTIKDVYPTAKWEDTAISDIAFYNQGAKIDVDLSKYAAYLKKAP